MGTLKMAYYRLLCLVTKVTCSPSPIFRVRHPGLLFDINVRLGIRAVIRNILAVI